MTKRTLVPLLAVTLVAASSASAAIGALDPVPSATLLFPYFEAESGSASATDTVLVVENTAATATLTHVIVWSDRGVPVLDFDLYLTPQASERLSLRALLGGDLPESAAGSAEAGCAFPLADLDDSAVADLKAALTGQHMPSVTDASVGCPGVDHGDTLARGYVTVDTVTACSTVEVSSGVYWGTKLSSDNALLGSFSITQGADLPSYAEQAVHIEASATDPRTIDNGDSTFYGSFVNWTAADQRERLPTMWSTGYNANRSDVVVWRETKRTLTTPDEVSCLGEQQAALELPGTGLQYLDEAEQITFHGGDDGGVPFVHATGRYPVGGASGLPTPYRSGMLLMNLNFAQAGDPASADGLAQSVVLSLRRPDAVGSAAHGTLSLGTPLDNGYETLIAQTVPATSEYGPPQPPPRAMLDPASAASLVLPYFEVSLDDPNAAQTLFRVRNTSASARLAKVTLYTDRGVPTEDFMVYLTGYDMATIDLRLLFAGGLGAYTASDGQDPQDTISPQGSWSQDINFASCTGLLPLPILDDERLAFLRAAHTGASVSEWDGACGGSAIGDGVARGYLVVDDYNACTIGPYSALDANRGERNGLAGSFEVRNRTDDWSYAAPLLPLQANEEGLAAGEMTFNGWLDAWAVASGDREALPAAWRVPFVNDATLGTTDIIFFRPVHRSPTPYACDEVPASFAGGVASFVAFDGQDNSSAISGFVPGVVAGRFALGAGGIAVPYASGALEIDLAFPEANGLVGLEDEHMGFVGAVQRPTGSADSTFLQGFPLRRAGEP